MLNKQLEEVIEKFKITKTDNIIYGTNIPMPNRIIPTPWKTYIRFDESRYYFFLFDEKGISIYPTDGETCATIHWEDIVDFKVSHIFILGKMTIKTETDTFTFQLNRFVFGCFWIGRNTKHLEQYNYYYPKKN